MASFLKGLLSTKALAVGAVGAVAIYAAKKYFNGGQCQYTEKDIDLKNKFVIITGANTGIGKESAIALARMGAHVVVAGRDEKRCLPAVDDIKRLSGNNSIEFMALDLADLDSVRKFAADYRQKHTQLHILLNNAGVMACPKSESKQGYELQFATNHLGHFLLTQLLLDVLKASAPARIVNVSSNAHRRGTLDLSDLDWKKREYKPLKAYEQSKLANVLFTEELARRLTGTGVTTHSLHPGVIPTELARHFDWKIRAAAYALFPLVWLMMKDVKSGAQTSIWCSVAPELAKEETGKYYADCKFRGAANKQSGDAELAKRLWETSEQMVAKK